MTQKLFNTLHPMTGKGIFLPLGEWDYDGRIRQRLDKPHAEAIANELNARVAGGEPGIPVYQGHPDVPCLAAHYPDKGALGWIVRAALANQGGREGLELAVEWDRDPGRGFRWFSQYWTCNAREGGTYLVDGIESVGLVNNPNIPEFRLANESPNNESDLNNPNPHKETIMELTKLIELLGLPPDATEEAVAAAIAKGKAALDAAAGAESAKAEAETAAANAKTRAEAAEAEAEEARKKQQEAETALANERAARRGLLLDQAIAEGRIGVAARAAWEKRLTEDFAAGSVALANERAPKTESAVTGRPAGGLSVDLVALAYVQISPVANPNLAREMQVDRHLSALGVRLSKDEALQRYQRTEAETDDDALEAGEQLKSTEVERLKGSGLFNSSTVQPFNSREAVALRNAAETPSADETALARALQSDLRPVAERLRDLLQEEGDFAAACKRLREELPDLLREIGQEESKFAKTLEGILGTGGAARSDERRVPSDERGEEDNTKDGKAEETALANSTQVWHKCPRCGKFDGFDGHCGKCGFVLGGKEARARTAALLDKAARDDYAKPVQGIAYREELGRIDLEVGKWGEFVPGKSGGGEWKHGTGLSKIRMKHGEDIDHLPDTLAFGKILRTREQDDSSHPENKNRRAIVHGHYVAFLVRAGNAWKVTTHYKDGKLVGRLTKIAEAL